MVDYKNERHLLPSLQAVKPLCLILESVLAMWVVVG